MTCPNCEKKFSIKKMFLTLTLIGVGLYSLKTFASGSEHKMNNGDQIKMNDQTRKSLDEKSKGQVMAVLRINEKLHDSFYTYDKESIEVNAKKLKESIDEVSNPEISKLLKFSQGKLSNIKSSNDRETNNKNYHLVSMALIHIINTYNVGKDYNAYSCPMVKKKWLQNSKKVSKIHNPYAPGMPHCGSQDSSY